MRVLERVLSGGLTALLVLAVTLSSAVSPAKAAAYGPDQALSAQIISDFTKDPAQLLSQFPAGGAQMITRVRDLLASDPATLAAILSILPKATPEQKAAIGSALGQAARLYSRTDPAFANQIQQAVTNTGDRDLMVAYATVTGDQPIGAGGPGAGGSPGGPGGQTNALGGTGTGGSGSAQAIGGSGGVNSGTFSFTGGSTSANGLTGVSGSGTSSNTTTILTTTTSP